MLWFQLFDRLNPTIHFKIKPCASCTSFALEEASIRLHSRFWKRTGDFTGTTHDALRISSLFWSQTNESMSEGTSTARRIKPGYEKSAKESTSSLPRSLIHLVSGGIAGCVAKSSIAPFDRVKILFQVINHCQWPSAVKVDRKLERKKSLIIKQIFLCRSITLNMPIPVYLARCQIFPKQKDSVNYGEVIQQQLLEYSPMQLYNLCHMKNINR